MSGPAQDLDEVGPTGAAQRSSQLGRSSVGRAGRLDAGDGVDAIRGSGPSDAEATGVSVDTRPAGGDDEIGRAAVDRHAGGDRHGRHVGALVAMGDDEAGPGRP